MKNEQGTGSRDLTYLEAIREALWEEMERDPSVFLMGEDIGQYGGAFKITKGFLERFGEDRVIDTPISEAAIIGAATGAAMMGLRPVVEMQFIDFIACGFDQLVNMAAKAHYRTGTAVPLVIRGPAGGGVHGGPFHSQNPEGWLFHTPGLKVVCPATPSDAKGLLTAAIRDDNPVIYLEYKYLYRRIKGEVPEGEHLVPLGQAQVRREGSDISIITYGPTLYPSLEAAEALAGEGTEVEVLDLRSLVPLDKEAMINTVKKTGKLLIIHEDTRTGGVGAEIAAIIAEEAFEHLDGPIHRIAGLDTPVPFSPPLEEYFLPNTQKIIHALKALAKY